MLEYIVQNGDTLSYIAKIKLGDANRWIEIANLNHLANFNLIFIGQKLRLPDLYSRPLGGYRIPSAMHMMDSKIPAHLALARGFLFVVFEQLPDIGTGKIIRKVAAIPRDFSLSPANPSGNLSLAEHAFNVDPKNSQFLSASNKAFGAPSINGQPVILDVSKIQKAGGQVYSVHEVVADLERFAKENPRAGKSIEKIISVVRDIEGEVLIKGGTPSSAGSHPSTAHKAYIRSAEDLWVEFSAHKLSKAQLEQELSSLERAYSKARILGKLGRVLTVVGVIVTVADLTYASQQSIQQRSFRPLGAETLRQSGGWGGVMAGARIGLATGALFGIETGPGAIVTGAIGAIVFGAAGYFSADWVADHISAN